MANSASTPGSTASARDRGAWKEPHARCRSQGPPEDPGLIELFTERAEPSFDELPPKEFFDRFPEGDHALLGATSEREKLRGMARLSHVMPTSPGNIRVSGLATHMDCDDGPPSAINRCRSSRDSQS